MRQRLLMSLALSLSGIFMMAMGVMRGEVEIVFSKAIHICLECIGIG
ncbi:CD1871A family CXXC motif-containing protein [Anaerocolumna sp. MB42-C2]|nr:CD1871A family CXXC motif-containing protein [Anaerocolumna sp. MB42-C2]WMJ90521.1 CD1871A family CXXC motif-containing protein [Anaerocolumna sp. MB42-C2]